MQFLSIYRQQEGFQYSWGGF